MRLTATLLVSAILTVTALLQSAPAGGPELSALQKRETSREDEPKSDEPKQAARRTDEKRADSAGEERPIVTHHEVTVHGKPLAYDVTAGLMPIKDAEGKTEANIFYMAYTAKQGGSKSDRPLMFSFNGGPGSASVWLHLGALGPKRVKMPSDATFPAPPFKLIDNEYTWLEQTDLVFIDPVGTGYSRAAKPELAKKFYSLRGDIESVGEFIRMYLTRHDRWGSPLFLVGESYGTTRAAGLAGYLIDRGVAFNGIVLVSTVLNFQTLSFDRGNDLPYILYLPVYTATAWYHKKLPTDLQAQELQKTLDEAERWAATEYTLALGKGERLQGEERRALIEKIARYTGLEPRVVDDANLRVSQRTFCRELLRAEKRLVGRLDSRYKGTVGMSLDERGGYDPSNAAITAPFTAMFQEYVRGELGYKSDLVYHVLGTGIGPWDWGTSGRGYPETSEALKTAFNQNPHMKLFIASGHFDLATPYPATEYTLDHMGLDPVIRDNIRIHEYEAGHMMYIHEESLAKLNHDVAEFIRTAAGS